MQIAVAGVGGGKLRRRCCVSSFLNCYFSDKIYQNGVRHSFNFHFSLLISKKRSKNPSLDDSPHGKARFVISILKANETQKSKLSENHAPTWIGYVKIVCVSDFPGHVFRLSQLILIASIIKSQQAFWFWDAQGYL